VIQSDNILALNKKKKRERKGRRNLRATRLNPVGFIEVIIGIIVVIAVVVQGCILGFAAVEIVEGLDVVGVMHIILRLHRGNLRERGIEEPTIGMQRKGEKSRARELGTGKGKEKNVCSPCLDICLVFWGRQREKMRKGKYGYK